MNSAFDVSSTRLDALCINLHSADLGTLQQALAETADKYRRFTLPFILNLQAFERVSDVDLAAVFNAFAEHKLPIRALRHGDKAWAEAAAAHGISYVRPFNGSIQGNAEGDNTPPADSESNAPASLGSAEEAVQTMQARQTIIVSAPVRAGQQVYAEKADLIVLDLVSHGAELIADGNIHVYAPMRGRALAGASGDTNARIFIQSMQAELVSIAGIYRVFEQQLPPHLHKQAVKIELQDERLAVSAINAS